VLPKFFLSSTLVSRPTQADATGWFKEIRTFNTKAHAEPASNEGTYSASLCVEDACPQTASNEGTFASNSLAVPH
jgi:hypothetical protein